MPATSRKRNKGKERKAKKAAAEEAEIQRFKVDILWRSWARGEDNGTIVVTQCNHGFDEIPDESHPVSRFISDYFIERDNSILVKTHAKVWNNKSYRKMATDVFTRMGANLLIMNKTKAPSTHERFITNVALGITMIENFGNTYDYDSTIYCRDVASKVRDLDLYCGRDLLKFYRKRMNCKCLKKMHLEARKTQPKLGKCQNCEVVKDRSLLMVCSRCRMNQYCSRKCQVAASPNHREDCNEYVKVLNNKQTKRSRSADV